MKNNLNGNKKLNMNDSMNDSMNKSVNNSMYKNMEKSELLALMEKCGHFLYHRRGGKRGQVRILKILATEGEKSQKELQNTLDIQSGSMSEIVLKMEAAGLIERNKDEADKRNINIKITEKGRIVFEENIRISHEQEQTLFKALNEHEQENLSELLSKLFESWQNSYEKSLFEHHRR